MPDYLKVLFIGEDETVQILAVNEYSSHELTVVRAGARDSYCRQHASDDEISHSPVGQGEIDARLPKIEQPGRRLRSVCAVVGARALRLVPRRLRLLLERRLHHPSFVP